MLSLASVIGGGGLTIMIIEVIFFTDDTLII